MRVPTLIALVQLVGASVSAQTVPAATDTTTHSRPTPIRLWQIGAAAGGIALISLADQDVRHFVLDHRTQGEQDLAGTWQRWGEGTIPVSVALGTVGAGLILQRPEVTRTGGRVSASLIAVTLIGRGLKKVIGRARPSEAPDQYTFDPFGKTNAFPSGHTITAFAISTSLADAIHNKWADAGLYTLAAGTGVSRLIGDHHWLSDVVGGAVLGYTTAKIVDGKWSLFGLHSPEFLVGPHGAGLRWTMGLPRLRTSSGVGN